MGKLNDSASPHLRGNASVTRIMLCVILALLPAAITGCLNYGRHAALVLLVTVSAAVLFDFFSGLVFKRINCVKDMSAAVTGLLLGMCLPPDFPLWKAAIGSFLAIVAVKQAFGGIGKNIANPAAAAWIMLLLVFHKDMTTWRIPMTETIVSSAQPLSGSVGYWDLLFGSTAGNIGETCAAGLILGGIFLCLCGITSPAAPVGFLGSFALLSWIGGFDVPEQLLTGAVMIGAFFFANDYTTTPLTKSGKFLFGTGCGVLTFLIRHYGGFSDGTLIAVAAMNLFTPMLDRLTAPVPFGAVRKKKTKKSKKQETAAA
ncbi:MAG: RnfABCDGE type electron transport complex subunit D [Oscillospiraceae bacterium]|nr:RnfABCDGE type electron transport complex subunit D [Oscillospiraceae bacterium]